MRKLRKKNFKKYMLKMHRAKLAFFPFFFSSLFHSLNKNGLQLNIRSSLRYMYARRL